MVNSKLRRHKVMEKAIKALMSNNLPPRFKFKDTYDSIEVPSGYTLPSQQDIEDKFDELLAEEESMPTIDAAIEDIQVISSNLYVNTNTGRVGIGTTSPNYALDVNGTANVGALTATTGTFSGRVDSERYLTSNTFPLPDPNQHSFRHVCTITAPTIPYGLTQAGGCIYEYNPSTGDTVRVVDPVSEPTAGTFAATAGREYFPMGSPMTIVHTHKVVPFTNLGSLFGFVENRFDASTVYLYAPYSNVTVEYFHETSVTGTPTSTIVVPSKTVTTFICTSDSDASGNDSHIFVVKGGKILMSSTGNGGDTRVLAPLSTIAYGYSTSLANDIYLENNVTTSGKCVYSNQNVPLILSQTGDGDGSDGTCAIPIELVADTYIVPHDIRGWEIQFLYTETVVNVSYWSATNSQWEQYGTYSPSGTPSILSPEELQVGKMSASGTDIGTTHTLWMFSGTKDFTLTVEEYTELERIVSGFRAHQVAQQIQTNLLDNVVQDSSGNVGIGTTSPQSQLHVKNGDISISQGYRIKGLRSDNTEAGYIISNSEGWKIGENRGGSISEIDIGYDRISFSCGGERMRITSGGNVGIGTTSPAFKLDVHGTSNVGALTATTGTFSDTVTADTFSGNATTATQLATARAINGVDFDGSDAISVNGLNYNVNNAWLRENGDNAHFKQYGNSRQMVFRTDGTTQYASDVGAYPFAWMYGGDASSNRRMLLNTSGQLWCSDYGWLHDKFMARTQVFSDTNSNASFTGQTIDFNSSGSQANTTDRVHRALLIDMDSSATGGDTNHEHRMYGINLDVRHSGDSDLVYAMYSYARSDHTSGTTTNLRAGDFSAVASGTGTNTNIYGINSYALKDAGSTGTTASMYGVRGEVEVDAGTCTNAYAFQAHIDRDGGTITNGYLYYGSYAGTVGTKWGIYLTGETKNYFSGNVGIGTASPSDKLHVNGGNLRISAAAGGGVYDNGYQWLECDNDTAWYRLTNTPKTSGIACYNGIAINENGGLVVGSWDSPNALGVGNGKFTGDLTVDGKIYNYNYTEVDINAPAAASGTWTTKTTSEWGAPKFNNTYDRFRYNDAPGYLEYTIPTGMKSVYVSQLQWHTGGYVDIHGVQSDGGLVFLRRINTRQTVENSNERNPDQHDGVTITFAGSGLQSFSKIRLTNKLGRFHLTGLAFTPNENEGTEGTGMVHTAQISDLSGHPVQCVGQNVNNIVAYGAAAGRFITPLDITITPKFSNSKIMLHWVIHCEAHNDQVFRVYRGSTLIGYNTNNGGRWSGVSSAHWDGDYNSTMNTHTVVWVDTPNTTSAVTYRVYCQSSNSGNHWITLNKTVNGASTGQDAYETAVSYKSAMEIAV
jgi:hypothetical protein